MERDQEQIDNTNHSDTDGLLEQTIKSILGRINEQTFNICLAMDWLKDARDAGRLVERHEALYIASDHINCIKQEFDKFTPYTLRKIKDDEIRNSLAHSISSEAIETIVRLKNRGLFND